MKKYLILLFIFTGIIVQAQPVSDVLTYQTYILDKAKKLQDAELKGAVSIMQELDSIILSNFSSDTSHQNRRKKLLFDIKDIALKSNHHKVYYIVLGYVGSSLLKFDNQVNTGIDFINHAIKALENDAPASVLAFWYYRMGQGYSYSGLYSKAIEIFERSISHTVADDSTVWYYTKFELANCLYQLSQYQQAAKHIKDAIHSKTASKEIGYLINGYNTLGLIEKRKNDIPSATAYFNKGLKLAEQYDKKDWTGIIWGNIGSCYEAQQNYKKAIQCYQKDIEISKQTEQYESVLSAAYALCNCHIQLNELKKLKSCVDSTEVYFKRCRPSILKEFPKYYQIKAAYYKITNQHDSAYNYLEKYIESVLRTESKKNLRQLNEMRVLLQSAENERKILLLEAEKAQIENDKKLRQTVLVFSLLALVLLSIILAHVLRKNIKQKRQNSLLEEQKEDLTLESKRLKELNDVKNKLFSIISHDLRNPFLSLNGILSLFDAKALSSKEVEELMLQIRSVTQGLYHSLSNLLEWSKSQMDGFKSNIEPVNLSKVIQEQIDFLNQQTLFKAISINNFVKSDELIIQADNQQICFIVRNILNNAIKFTHVGGSIYIKALKEANFITISIEDTGIGMSEKQLKNIFQQGIKTSMPGTLKEKGTGLGLLVCKDFAEANGGSIDVKSTPNVGTTFYITFPIKEA